MSLLTIVQSACNRLGLDEPSSVVANAERQIEQLLGLAQQEGKELARRTNWQKLSKETTFTSTATETQSGVIPSDFDRFISRTFFNRTRKRPVKGPLSASEWATQKALTATVLFDSFRQRGGNVLMLPTPTAGDTYAFEYVSNQWCETSGGTDQSAWAADSDVGLLDEELMTLGVIWRFLRAKGFDYAEAFRTYETQVMQAIARDGGKRTLNFADDIDYDAARYPGFPEGSWSL